MPQEVFGDQAAGGNLSAQATLVQNSRTSCAWVCRSR